MKTLSFILAIVIASTLITIINATKHEQVNYEIVKTKLNLIFIINLFSTLKN